MPQGNPTLVPKLKTYPVPGGDRSGSFIAWDAGTGEIKWSNEEKFSGGGALATAGGIVFYGTVEGYLKAVDDPNW